MGEEEEPRTLSLLRFLWRPRAANMAISIGAMAVMARPTLSQPEVRAARGRFMPSKLPTRMQPATEKPTRVQGSDK